MRKLMMTLLVLGLCLRLAMPVLAQEQSGGKTTQKSATEQKTMDNQADLESVPGLDDDGMAYGGYGMMDGYHRGMYGGRGGYERRMRGQRIWSQMSPEQRTQYKALRAKFLMDTMDTRKELASKQVELRTLWAQPKPDRERMRELSNEISDLRNQLQKQWNEFRLQCRGQFGDKGWSCPGVDNYGYDNDDDWWPFW